MKSASHFKTSLLAVSTALITGALGWCLGQRQAAPHPTPTKPVVTKASADQTDQLAAALSNPRTAVKERLSLLATQLEAGPSGFAALISALESAPYASTDLIKSLLDAWVTNDPLAACEWDFSHGSRHNLVNDWWLQAPQDAINFLVKHGKGDSIVSMLDQLSAKKPKEALQCFEQLPEALKKNKEYLAVRIKLRAGGLETLREMLSGEKPPIDLYGSSDIEKELMKQAPEEVMNLWYKHLEGGRDDYMLERLIGEFAAIDPIKAQTWIDSNTPNDKMRAKIVESLAKRNPDSAWDLAQTLSDSKAIESAGKAKVVKIAETDPAAALEFARSAANLDLKTSFFRSLGKKREGETEEAAKQRAQELAIQAQADGLKPAQLAKILSPHLSSTEMTDWLKTQPIADREAILLHFAESFDYRDLAKKSQLIVNGLADLPNRAPQDSEDGLSSQFARAMSEWAGNNPAQADQLLTQLPDGQLKETGRANLAVNWFFADQAGATDWLEKQPSTSGRDLAVAEIVNEWSVNQPEKAAQLTAEISTPVIQGRIVNLLKQAQPQFLQAFKTAYEAKPWGGEPGKKMAEFLAGKK